MTAQQRILAAFATAMVFVTAVAPATAARKPQTTAASGYERRDDVRAFIDELVREHGFSRPMLRRWFADVRYQPKIVAAMQRPLLEPPPWNLWPLPTSLQQSEHPSRFRRSRPRRRDAGDCRSRFVPAEIIVAIIGVETFYGATPAGTGSSTR